MKTKTVSWLVAILPLLSVCRSFIPGVDMGTALAIIVSLLCMTSEKRLYIRKRDPMNLFLLFIFLTTMINTAFFDPATNPGYASTVTTVMRLGKFLIMMLIFFSLDYIRYINVDMTMSLISKVVTFNTGLIMLQRVAYQMSGVSIRNPLSFIATSDAYNSSGYTMRVGSYIRPSGIFFEPSHYAQYCVLYLCYLLFGNKKIEVKKVIIVSTGIVVTGSGMGILMLFAILSVYLLIRFYKNMIRTIIYSTVLVIVVVFLLRSPFIQTMLDRLFSNGIGYGGNAIDARIGNGYDIFTQLGSFNKLFGFGYGRVPNDIYLNGATYLLNTIGIVGCAWYFIVLARFFARVPAWGRWTIVCYIVLLIGAQLFSPASIIFFIGVTLSAVNERNNLRLVSDDGNVIESTFQNLNDT